MKFRNRLILAYTAVALIASLALGVILSRTGLQYESSSQKNNLLISANSYVTQLDETLDSMDAIMQYLLADPSILEGITMLSTKEGDNSNSLYTRNAETAIKLGLSTVYIMNNSYRTVFFNEKQYYSSSVRIILRTGEEAPVQKLRTAFSVEDIPYISLMQDSRSKAVIVPAHEDYWAVEGSEVVFSLMRQIRGEGMGYLEVEKRLSDLEELESSDPDIRYVISLSSGETLYAKDSEYNSNESLQIKLDGLTENEVQVEDGMMFAKAASDQYGFTISVYKNTDLLEAAKRNVFTTSFLAGFIVFGICLLFIIYMSGRVTKPIRALQQVVEHTNIENLGDSRKLAAQGGPDEFQELMNSYQNMTTRLDTALTNEKRSSILQLQAQFDMLQTQVNPHFIYNVLNIISARAVMADDEVISEMCGCLGNMLRYSTNNKERYATLRQEIDHLNNYFYLLKMRYEDRLEITVDIPEEIMDLIVPKMTLQQLVENAVKHGFNDTGVHMNIEVIARVTGDQWTITVQDNGLGIEEDRLNEIRERLDVIRKDVIENKEVPTEAEIGGLGLANTYARCLLVYQNDLIFEMGNRYDRQGFRITLGCSHYQNSNMIKLGEL